MLVLSAAYNSKILKQLVPEDQFKKLIVRTIKFLRQLSDISPTCKADCGILEKFQNLLFPITQEHPALYHGEEVEALSTTNSFGAST